MTFKLSRSIRILSATLCVAFSVATAVPAWAQHRYTPNLKPVAVISDTRLAIATPDGHAQFPLYLSSDSNVAQPQIVRAVIVIHGKLRNADVYFTTAQKARAAADTLTGTDANATLLIAP